METTVTADGHSELVFHAPTFQDEFGKAGFVFLVMAFLAPCVLAGALAFALGVEMLIVPMIFIGMAFGCIAGYGLLMFLGYGRVVLTATGLVEYNYLNFARKFSYGQICEVKRGNSADTLWIRYYPLLKSGQIDYKHARGTQLIAVRDAALLQRTLANRMTAPMPRDEKGALRRLVGWGLLLVLAVVLALVYPMLMNGR